MSAAVAAGGTIAPFRTFVVSRRKTDASIRCEPCSTTHTQCPTCGKKYVAVPEKGVDALMVADDAVDPCDHLGPVRKGNGSRVELHEIAHAEVHRVRSA